MGLLNRIGAAARALFVRRNDAARRPEVWCRPATVIALRDQRDARACVAGWSGRRPR